MWKVIFHPDGKHLASCGEDHKIKIWNLEHKRKEQTFVGHDSWLFDIRYNSNCSLLARASEDGTARLWDEEGKQVAIYVHGAPVNGVCFSPDDLTVATAAADCRVRLWSAEPTRRPGDPMHKRLVHSRTALVLDVSFSSDGKSIATSATDNQVQIWDEDGVLSRTCSGHNGWIMRAVFTRWYRTY